VLVMSNGGFGGVHGKLLDALAARERRAPHALPVVPLAPEGEGGVARYA
jgi:hypothetical protein